MPSNFAAPTRHSGESRNPGFRGLDPGFCRGDGRESGRAWLRWVGAAAFVAASGCAVIGQRVPLNYAPSQGDVRIERKTPIQVVPFVDSRSDRKAIGRAPTAIPGVQEPLRPEGDIAAWVTRSVSAELSAVGYRIVPESEWKVGGAVESVECGGHIAACSVRIKIGVHAKGSWQALQHEYAGSGSMPPVLQHSDLFALSLEEALRDVLDKFKRDVALTIP